jgi:hypothetical protein
MIDFASLDRAAVVAFRPALIAQAATSISSRLDTHTRQRPSGCFGQLELVTAAGRNWNELRRPSSQKNQSHLSM